MNNIFITIDGVTHEFAEVTASAEAAAPRELVIQRPWVVYSVDGIRQDGYKYESRARRNNDARFAGTGYWLGRADTGVFSFVSA